MTPRDRPLALHALDGRLAVCRLPLGAPAPPWAESGPFVAVVRTEQETSVVCDEERVPPDVERQGGWVALVVAGPLDFALTGVLAAIAVPMRDAGVSIFAVSTYDTDYVLVPAERLGDAVSALRAAGHTVA
jgi:uncharacterized protein